MSDPTPTVSTPYSYSYHRVGHDGEEVPVFNVSAIWVSVVGIGAVRVFFYDGTFHMNDTPKLYKIDHNEAKRGTAVQKSHPDYQHEKATETET